jgi:hypothetical protein
MSLNQLEDHLEANSPQMDLGVGSFVFSQGIISAIPLIKDPSYLTSSLPSKLFKVIRKSLPVIFLGLVRVLLVKGTEYPVSIQPPVIFVSGSYR